MICDAKGKLVPIFSTIVAVDGRLVRTFTSDMTSGLADSAGSGVTSITYYIRGIRVAINPGLVTATVPVTASRAFNRIIEAISDTGACDCTISI